MITFDRGIELLVAILAISLVLCFIRLYIGPNVPNRTAAFDTIAVHAVGILALLSMSRHAASLLDIAIVTAILGFLGTTMLAYYLERGARQPKDERQNDPTLRVEPD